MTFFNTQGIHNLFNDLFKFFRENIYIISKFKDSVSTFAKLTVPLQATIPDTFIWGNVSRVRMSDTDMLIECVGHVHSACPENKRRFLLKGHPKALLMKILFCHLQVWRGL